ncbi:MAG: Ig-like domain-containing protein, partial [Treponema sp.]|nr:Ig-like domain-containing protein [Treponema sp.]
GKKLTFLPLTQLNLNTDYTISVSADAHDTKGLSLDEAFNRYFTTRPDNVRPVLISCFPAMYDDVRDPEMQVKLEFSIPVPEKTLYDNVSFNPSITGIWSLEDNGKLAVFTPAEPWVQNNRYEIRFSSSLADNNGMNIGNDFLSIFTTGKNEETPYLLGAYRIANNGDVHVLDPDRGYSGITELPVENQNWEKDDKLLIIFNNLIDSVLIKNYVSIEDGPGITLETTPGFKTEFIFKLESRPVYESRFTIKIKSGIKDILGNESKDEYIFRIFTNGIFSRPPRLAGIRIPMAPGDESDPKMIFYSTNSLFDSFPITDENYPSGEVVKTWIELYFSTADGALIDTFSLMELFRTETSNNVISFSPHHVKTAGFSVTNPQSGYENYQRIEITGNLTNSTNNGIINFQISPGLKDNFGNINEKLIRISLLK